MPRRILDLYVEHRCLTNGFSVNRSLLGALAFHGLDHAGGTEKKALQQAIGTGQWRGTISPETVLDYCESDVTATARLFTSMFPLIDLPRALLRGRYMAAVAAMENNGVPVDAALLDRLRAGWHGLQDALIAAVDESYGIFEGRTFKLDRFEAWLSRAGIPWPRLASGQLDLSEDTFRTMAKVYPIVAPLHELRVALSSLRLNDLAVGKDGRNRTLISPFGARSGRNTPSNSRGIFGPSTWIRGLIRPPEGYAVAYLDYGQQEFAIAAALSGDVAMKAAYRSGDPYLTFAKQAGAVPPDATRKTHNPQRELFKTAALGVQYGMESESLARRLDQPPIVGRDLLAAHRRTYPTFWRWSDSVVDTAMTRSKLTTVFGWTINIGAESNPRSLRNLPMQGGGGDMLRIACCLATERGVGICMPVHDALLICAPVNSIESHVATARNAMIEASEAVLPDFPLRVDDKIVRYPDRYMDSRGEGMWDRVMRLLDRVDAPEKAIA
jgi:hypothetical protein